MNDFVLNIDGYEGSIELLLDLAKKQKVDLKHILVDHIILMVRIF